jgi:hypothetical protein
MGAIATFDPAAFRARYGEFANCTDPQLQGCFDDATLYLANDGSGPVETSQKQLSLLNMLTAHIAWLTLPRDPSGQPAATGVPPNASTVGRIESAGEGSVNVGLDMGDATAGSPSQAWYMQTQYGASYWAATAPYRTARYAANPTFVPTAVFPGFYPGLFPRRRF